MTKLILFAMLIFNLSPAVADINVCEALYEKRHQQFSESFSCFEDILKGNSSLLEKATALNRQSYLNFYYGIHLVPSEKLQAMEDSLVRAKSSAELLAPWLDEAKYQTLNPELKRQLSFSLYYYGTALAARAEIQGDLAVVLAWPEIQKVMRLILRLGNADVKGYGAYRTLAIANTRIPAIAGGDKKLAEQYFKLILKNTTSHPANTIGYADLLRRLDRTSEACSLIQSLLSLNQDQVLELQPGILEVSKDIKEAKSFSNSFCR